LRINEHVFRGDRGRSASSRPPEDSARPTRPAAVRGFVAILRVPVGKTEHGRLSRSTMTMCRTSPSAVGPRSCPSCWRTCAGRRIRRRRESPSPRRVESPHGRFVPRTGRRNLPGGRPQSPTSSAERIGIERVDQPVAVHRQPQSTRSPEFARQSPRDPSARSMNGSDVESRSMLPSQLHRPPVGPASKTCPVTLPQACNVQVGILRSSGCDTSIVVAKRDDARGGRRPGEFVGALRALVGQSRVGARQVRSCNSTQGMPAAT